MQIPRSVRPLTALRLRRSLRLAPALVLAWTLATLVAVRLSGVDRLGEISPGQTLGRSLIVGLLVGLSAAWLEGNVLPSWGRRLPLVVVLVLQTVVYALIVLAAAASVAGLVLVRRDTPSLTDVREIDALLGTWAPEGFLTILILSSLLINLWTQLRRALGPGMLTALFIGRYRRPVSEERAFLFLDLDDSTALAEVLGPLRFTAFKSDFFADLGEPVLDTHGRIVQYVGDGVMLTWPMRRTIRGGAPLRFFFLLEEAVAARAARYRARYGFVLKFKAGVHGGEVVTAQVGDLHRDIVHSGDVVNTAARLAGECHRLERRLLVSGDLLHRMALPEGLGAEDLGTVPLRGKQDEVGLFSVERLTVGGSAAVAVDGPAA